MSFISILDNIGTVFADILKFATDAEPAVNEIFPSFAPLYDDAVEIITTVEAAFGASGAKNVSKQKLAAAVALLHPKVVARHTALKIAIPTMAQTQAYTQSVVDGLKAYAPLNAK